ncbi:MAG: hypothetical protein JWO05_635 [Gemmatimonadetes bacterium]|nr:hypothetical protein [Gemmatimonadota bacterium]
MRSNDISPLSQLLARVDAITDGHASVDSVVSGFPSLDKILGGGFRRGDLTVLGGDVGSGKSALALAIALRSAQEGAASLFLSGEMTVERVLERILAIEARVRVDELRAGSLTDTGRVEAGATALRLRDQLPRIDRIPSSGIEGIRTLVPAEAPVSLLVLDGIQELAAGSRGRDEEIAAAVLGLKTLALDLNIAILATAQLPMLESRPDQRPMLDDFGVLGAVKHHADVVLGLFREGMYNPSREIEGATELLVGKNRHGGTGYIDLYFYAQWMRFEDMLDPDR